MPGVTTAQGDYDNPIRVVITPSQSSFFAGEQFSVTITFTNTRTPGAGPSRVADSPHVQTRTHKRGAHSISSAPLARPPTSPGTPRTVPDPSPRKLAGLGDDVLPGRKGLVGTMKKGHQDGQLPVLIQQRRKKLLAKSLSVSISSQELEEQLGEGIIAATPASASFDNETFPDTRKLPTSPLIPSPLSRTNTLPLSSSHPHARKQSVLDGQLSLDALSPTTSTPPQPYTPTTSLSLSAISEGSLSFPTQSSTSSLTSLATTRNTSPLSPSYSQPAFQPIGSSSNAVQAYPSIVASASSSAAGAAPRSHQNRRFSQQIQLGLGHPVNSRSRTQAPRTAVSSTFPQSSSEFILYSYAQFIGTVHVSQGDFSAVTPTQDQVHRMNRIRGVLIRKRVAIGGGSMDISQSLHNNSSINSSLSGSGSYYLNPQPIAGAGYPRKRAGHSRSASFSASLMSLLSPAPGSAPIAMSERAMTTSPSHLNSGATIASEHNPINGPGPGGGSGLGLGIVGPPVFGGGMLEDIDPELPLPTFEAQPSMLAVDLSLSPGESRSYTYSIKLPEVLPPTYKGGALRFSYELVVGTCRAAAAKSNLGPSGMNSISRVMKVPIRVYNHVTVESAPCPYNILWPVSRNRLSGLGKGKERNIPETQGKVIEETREAIAKIRKGSCSPPKSGAEGSLEDLRYYINRLVTSLPPGQTEKEPETSRSSHNVDDARSQASSSTTSLPPIGNGSILDGQRMSFDEAREQDEEDRGVIGCREAVEILTRLPKKASYDVNKDGVKVAVLTFTKSAYRLGETVSGIVELNERVGRARVLQLCAILEAHETLPTSIAPPMSARYLKRAYAEHHASFTLNTLRTTFALDIPSDASPAFQVNIDDSHAHSQTLRASPLVSLGGLEWKVRLCLLVAIASDSSDPGTESVYFKSLERDGPRGEWGSSWRAPRALAPHEKHRIGLQHLKTQEEAPKTKSWTQLLVDSVWSTIGSVGSAFEEEHQDDSETDVEGDVGGERSYDGIKPDPGGGVGKGVDFSGGEDGWKEVKLETVECEVPIKVWPGNTAFRAVDVVFDV